MRIVKNTGKLAEEVEQAIKDKDGYCCCQIKSEDSKCMCKDFREKIQDDNFYGDCECGLYSKVKS